MIISLSQKDYGDDMSSIRTGRGRTDRVNRYPADQGKLIRELQELLDDNDQRRIGTSKGAMANQFQSIDIDTAHNIDGLSYDSRQIDPSQMGIQHGLGTIGEEEIDDTRHWNRADDTK